MAIKVQGTTVIDDSRNIINTNNINVSGVSTFQGNVHFGDNDRLHFGSVGAAATGDLQIYHDGSDSYIDDVGSGNLNIRADNQTIIRNAGGNKFRAKFGPNQVELYYDNSKKFETTGIGVSIVNGTSDTATIAGPANLVIDPAAVGDNTGLVRIKGDLYVDGTTTQINSTTLELADFIVGIATTATTDILADGAGIQIGPDNTFLYEYNSGTNPSLKSSENLNVASGKVYQIDQTERLSADTLSLGTGTTIHSPSSNRLVLGTNGKIIADITRSVTTLNLSTGHEEEGVLKFSRQDNTDRSHYIRVYNSATQASNYMKFDVHNGVYSGSVGGFVTPLTLRGSGNVGIGSTNPEYTLDFGETSASTIRLVSEDNGTAIRIGAGGGDNDVTLLRVDGRDITHLGESDSSAYGFSLKYLGSGSANNNAFAIFSDDSTAASQVQAFTVLQDGKIGIGSALPAGKLDLYDSNASVDIKLSCGVNRDNSITFAEDDLGFFRILHDGSGLSNPNNLFKIQTATSSGGINNDAITIKQSGDVGIGTTNPGSTLSVGGTITELYNGSYWNVVTQADVGYGASQVPLNQYLGQLAFLDDFHPNGLRRDGGGSDDVVVGSAGSVGIGTTNPLHKLDVYGDINFHNDALISSYVDGDNVDHIWHRDLNSASYGQSGTWHFVSDGSYKADGNSAIRAGAFANMDDTGTPSQKLQITGGAYFSGDVGIGTTNPQEKLDVRGHIKLDSGPVLEASSLQTSTSLKISNTNGYIEIGPQNTTYGHIYTDRDRFYFNKRLVIDEGIIASYDEDLVFQTDHDGGATERVRILSSNGNVGIGTTNPDEKLEVYNGNIKLSGTTTQLIFEDNNSTNLSINRIYSYDSSLILSADLNADGDAGASIRFETDGSEKVRIKDNGNLGIGTNNPQGKLHISSGTSGDCELILEADTDNSNETDNPRILFRQDGGNDWSAIGNGVNGTGGIDDNALVLANSASGYGGIIFKTNNSDTGYTVATERMRISSTGTSTGNIGINSTSPTAKLDVNGDVAIASTVSIGTTIDIVPYNDLGALSFEGSAGQLFSITNNLTSGSIFSVNDVSGIPSIDVDADGTVLIAPYGSTEYVGIGTTNPTAKLDVNGNLKVSGVSTFQSHLHLGDDDELRLGDGSELKIEHRGNGDSTITESGSGALYIGGSRIIIADGYSSNHKADFTGTSVKLYYSNAKKFETTGYGVTVSGGAYISGISTFQSGIHDGTSLGTNGQVLSSTGTGLSWIDASGGFSVTNDTSTNSTYYPVFVDTTSGDPTQTSVSSTKLNFNPSSGNFSATQFTSLSDRTKKTNIRPVENAIEITKQLEGVRFDWIDNDKPSIGLIAQDVEKVLPELVETSDDGTKSVSYGNIIGVLIEAIKEQQKLIDQLMEK